MNSSNRPIVSKGHVVLLAVLLAGFGLFGGLVATQSHRRDSKKGPKVRAPLPGSVETLPDESSEVSSHALDAESPVHPADPAPRTSAVETRVAEWNAYLATFDLPNEVVERRDSYARHFRNSEGGFTALISPTPIQYRHPDGSWQAVELDLRHENGRYVNRTNVLKSEFPVISTDPDGARIGLSPEESYQWRPLSMGYSDAKGRYTSLYPAAPVAANTGAGEIEYAGLFPNATDRFRIESSLVKHDLVLSEAPPLPVSVGEGGTFDYVGEVRLAPGLVFERGSTFTSSEGVWVVDQNGERLFELAPPLAREVAGRERVAGVYRVSPFSSTDLYELRIQVPSAWLADPARKFPVEIDPTTRTINAVQVANSYAYEAYDPRWAETEANARFYFSSAWDSSGENRFADEDGYGGRLSIDCAVGMDFDWSNEFYRSSVEWDTSSIPDDQTIGMVSIIIKVADRNYDEFDSNIVQVYGYSLEQRWDQHTPKSHYIDCGDGTNYLGGGLRQTGSLQDYPFRLASSAASDLQRRLSANWFGLGLIPIPKTRYGEPDEALSDGGVITWLHLSPLEVRYSRPPSKPILRSPGVGQVIYSSSFSFSWSRSTDPDRDPLRYILKVGSQSYETVATAYTVPNLPGGLAPVTWSVTATDGVVSTTSDERWFRVVGASPNTNGGTSAPPMIPYELHR